MTSLVLGDLILESLTPSVNTPLVATKCLTYLATTYSLYLLAYDTLSLAFSTYLPNDPCPLTYYMRWSVLMGKC
jgi:hypothetical protein